MRPRTRLQMRIMECHQALQPLTDSQKKEAIRKFTPHMAKVNSKKECVCLDCGHSWKIEGEVPKQMRCPECGALLNVMRDRKVKEKSGAYFSVITTCHEFQVVRIFLMKSYYRKGEKPKHWIKEAYQYWMTEDGKREIVGHARNNVCHYADSWNWWSDMEIRTENWVHISIVPAYVVGKPKVLPILRRNGFKTSNHNCPAVYLFQKLLDDNKIETAWKSGQYELVRHAIGADFQFRQYWSSIRIAIRRGYKVKDASLWYDMLQALSVCGKDLRNPHYICPLNLQKAHDEWVAKSRAVQRKRQERAKKEQAARYEKKYRKAKEKFFGVAITDGDILIRPLTSVAEFVAEGEEMHHCVYSNKYFLKNDMLILHALVGGKSIATIELSLKDFTVIQCRGKCNSVPEEKERIITLLKENINQIAQQCA